MATGQAHEDRRSIEREYVAALNEAVPVQTWREICDRAAQDALAGDPRARDWLSRWLIGTKHRCLTTLAAEESGSTPEAATDQEIETRRKELDVDRREDEFERMMAGLRYPDSPG